MSEGKVRELTFPVPWPPSVNRYWRRAGTHVHVSNEGREYQQFIRQSLSGLIDAPFRGPLDLLLLCTPPDRRKRDIDNILKALLDALTKAGVWEDDSQIVDLHVVKYPPCPIFEGLFDGKGVVKVYVRAPGDPFRFRPWEW